jgi:hypothetical protein
MALEDTVATLAGNVADLVKTLSGSAATGNSVGGKTAKPTADTSAVSNVMAGMQKVAEGAVPLYLGFQKLTTGADVGASALGALSKGLSTVNLGPLAGVAQQTVGSILDWKTQLDASAKEMGIGGNNIGLFVKMAGDAGVTTKQFSDIVQKTGLQSLGLGANAQKGAEAFSKVAEEVRQSLVGQELQKLGMSSEELASITAVSAIQTRKSNMTQVEAALAAEQLAVQLDETSRLTGVSREQMAKELAADEKRPEIRALENLMQKEQIEGYQKSKKAMEMFGQPMVQLTSELASGKLSKAGQAQLAALGESGREYEAALKQQMAARSAPEKAAADAALEIAQAHVAARLASQQFSSQAVYSSGAIGDQSKKMMDGNQGMENIQKAAAEFRAKGMSENDAYVAALKKNKEDATNLRAGKDEKGKTDDGQTSARLLNEANRNATTQAAGLANNFKALNDGIKPGSPVYKLLTGAVDYTGKEKTGEEAATKQKTFAANAVDTLTGGQTKKTESIPTKDQDSSGRTAPYKANAVPKAADGGQFEGPTSGYPVILHGKETVIPADKMGEKTGGAINFSEISKTISTSISSVSGGGSTENKQVQNDSSKAAEKEMAAVREQMQAEKNALREQLKAKIGDGSKLGGSSTENKQVQNDSSKAAEKEMAAVREQMQAEKNALREQLKAKIGDGSKLGGNAVAKEMRTGDEGTAIAEKYKAMMEPLQKQIDAGISFETTKKASAIEETKKVVEEQTKITFSGSVKQLEAFKSKEKAEDDFFGNTKKKTAAELADQTAKQNEIFKAAEVARSVVGTSMQGLSDDAIQAMIPMGASMDDFYIDMNDNLQSFSNDSANNLKKVTDNEQASSTIKISASETARKVTEDMGLKSIESVGVAGKAQEEYHSQFTESQKKIIDDYKGYSEENRSFHAKAMEKGAKEDAETAQMIGERIIKMKADIGDRQATTEEAAAIRNEELSKEMFEKQVASKKEMQDVMENLSEYSATREKEIKQGLIADQQESAAKLSEITGQAINPDSAMGKDAMGKMEEAKATMAKSMGGMMDMPGMPKFENRPEIRPTEKMYSKNEIEKRSSGGISTGTIGSMFAPKIVDQAAADAQKAKIAEMKSAEAKKTSEAAPKKTDADSKKDAEAKADAAKKTDAAKKEEPKASTKGHEATLKDLNDQLVMLNKHMVELINHSEKSADANSKTAKATQKATGTR